MNMRITNTATYISDGKKAEKKRKARALTAFILVKVACIITITAFYVFAGTDYS